MKKYLYNINQFCLHYVANLYLNKFLYSIFVLLENNKIN